MKKKVRTKKIAASLSLLILIISFTATSCNSKSTQYDLPRSRPEEAGIRSEAIINFIQAMEDSDLELHSFMIIRHGNVAAEGWWDPYQPELKHTLYSTSKSFTSTAIGFAVTEGLISVEDKVISFFPGSLPDTISDNLAAMRIRDLLTMSAGQDPEPTFSHVISSDDWVKAFLSAPVPNTPGSKFLYNSSATYMLSAIITKVTGESVLDYLTPRLFEPLQIDGMDWEVDPKGINTGGWGLRLKTEDLAKFGQMLLQKGSWYDTQVIPEAWIDEATSKKIEQAPDLSDKEKSGSDWLQGYCYQFWRSRHNSFRADGAYGQYILVLPEKDAVIAITAEVGDMQKELNMVWDYLLPGMEDKQLHANTVMYDKLVDRIASLSLDPPAGTNNKEKEKALSGNRYSIDAGESNETMSFDFSDSKCTVTRKIGEDTQVFEFGEEKWIRGETDRLGPNLLAQPKDYIKELLPFKVAGAYCWSGPDTLELTLRYIESPHSEYFHFTFDGDELTLIVSNSRNSEEKLKLKGEKI